MTAGNPLPLVLGAGGLAAVGAWLARPGTGFRENAAAGILVLLVVLLITNSVAIWLRDRSSRRRDA